jgi:hypothetical protein
MNNDASINEFWQWFEAHSDEFITLIETGDFVAIDAMLKPRVRRLVPRANWEIGPGSNREWAFVLSPNASRERLQLTSQVISQAPELRSCRWRS